MLTCTGVLVGCSTDENIDLGEIDSTIGIGSTDFTLPGGSTKKTKLGDLLELKDNGVIDTLKRDSSGYHRGDYQFVKADTVKTATPKVKQVSFGSPVIPPSPAFTIEITNEMALIAGTVNPGDLPLITIPEKEIKAFNFSNTGEKAVISLTHATVEDNIVLDLNVAEINEALTNATFELKFPDFVEAKIRNANDNAITFDNNTHTLKLDNVNLSEDKHVVLQMTGLTNFKKTKAPTDTDESDYLLVNQDVIELNGHIKMAMIFDPGYLRPGITAGTKTISSNIDLGNEIKITHAEGYFDPEINIDPTSTGLGDIPDFLEDNRVNINIYNPSIKFEAKNNIDVEAILNGRLTAKYKDGTKRRLVIPNITMDAAPNNTVVTTTVVLCRYKPAVQVPGTKYIELNGTTVSNAKDTLIVQDISKLLNKIPDSLYIDFSAKANTSKLGKIDLYAPQYDGDSNEITEYPKSQFGCGYEIKPKYDFTSMLELEKGSTIVYNDTLNDLNKDLKDNKIDFYKDGYIMIMADLDNYTPLDMHIQNPKVVGVKDANGIAHPISSASVSIVDENGNILPGGLTIYKKGDPRNRKFCLKLSGSLEEVDGIVYEVEASVTQDTPETLNATRHNIQLCNMAIKLNGQISIKP